MYKIIVLIILYVAAMSPHQPCPHCHTSIAVARFEFAHDAGHTYYVCPECDEIVAMVADEAPVTSEPDAAAQVVARRQPAAHA